MLVIIYFLYGFNLYISIHNVTKYIVVNKNCCFAKLHCVVYIKYRAGANLCPPPTEQLFGAEDVRDIAVNKKHDPLAGLL